jgi:hypothetical protein
MEFWHCSPSPSQPTLNLSREGTKTAALKSNLQSPQCGRAHHQFDLFDLLKRTPCRRR